jgi:hypothetical protein
MHKTGGTRGAAQAQAQSQGRALEALEALEGQAQAQQALEGQHSHSHKAGLWLDTTWHKQKDTR